MDENEAASSQPTGIQEAPVRKRKNRITCLSCGLLVILVLVLLIVVISSLFFVWLPDTIPPHHWIHVDGVVLPNGQELHLFQRWSHDFYLTVIACKEKNRFVQVFYVDGDDRKRWRWDVRLDPKNETATISLDGNDYTYHWADGEFRSVEGLIGAYTDDELELKNELLQPSDEGGRGKTGTVTPFDASTN